MKYFQNTDMNEIFSKSRDELSDFGPHGFPHKTTFVAKFQTFSKFTVFLREMPELHPKNQVNSNDLQDK